MKSSMCFMVAGLVAALVLGFPGCASTGQAEIEEAEKVRAGIMAGIDTIMAGDYEGYVATFDDEGVLLALDKPPFIGKEGLTKFFKGMFGKYNITNRDHWDIRCSDGGGCSRCRDGE